MIGQDTGSAIVGPARADIYFGAGEDAGRVAGRIKNPARFVMLMPNALDPSEAGKKMPLPQSRPASAPKAEPSIAQPKSADPKSADPKPADPKPAEAKPAEPKSSAPQADVPLPRPRPKS
jgi:membrane-bound lytic murein transglycosylase A